MTNVCRDANSLGDAIFPSEVHAGCQMPSGCRGCLNHKGDAMFPREVLSVVPVAQCCRGMPYSLVESPGSASCLLAWDA